MGDVVIQIKPDLNETFGRFPDLMHKHMQDAMTQATEAIMKQSAKIIHEGATKRLAHSLEATISGFGSEIVGRVGSSLAASEDYPAVVEFGRPPGKMPPVKTLYQWHSVKMGVSDAGLPRASFAVARAIGKRGIKGRHYLYRGLKKSGPLIKKIFKRSVEEALAEVARGR